MNTIQKCYYCGGENDLSAAVDNRIRCRFCRRYFSIPSPEDQEKQALYDLGRQKMDLLQFQEAEKIFLALAEKDPDNGDVYWQALLCHFGVEYILDEDSGQNVPTVTLLTKQPILEHDLYLKAIRHAGSEELRATWQAEAEHISTILQTYEKVAATEPAYDVFISVKQGTPQGTPTSDSFEAASLMHFLESRGLKVFNSRLSLRNMVGQEYEPYIMAALMSARAMVVVGSSREYLEARWVRNEWRRFRWLQENGEGKRVLIPYLLGISPLLVPTEMGAIQCVSNTGASPYADILRAIRKAIPLRVARISPPVVVPEEVPDGEKAEWLEKVRENLEELNEFRDSIMPDLDTARKAETSAGVILTSLERLSGFAETSGMTREATALQKHFRSEYERIRLNECVTRLEEIASRMEGRITAYADACALQDELERIRKEISGYTGQSQSSSVMKRLDELLGEIRKCVIRLNPDNLITDPLRHALAVGRHFVAGLRKDGTVLVTGKGKDLVAGAESWRDIISLAAGSHHLVGLRRDGSVVAVGSNRKDQCAVSSWANVICIEASGDHTVALDSEGRCMGCGDNAQGQINVEGWQNIVSLSTSPRLTLGCDRTGKAWSAGNSQKRGTQLSGWSGIQRIFAVDHKAVGIREDGQVLLMGDTPRTEVRQDRWLNKKKNLYLSFTYVQGNAMAALTSLGTVKSVPRGGFRIFHWLICAAIFGGCVACSSATANSSRSSESVKTMFLVFSLLLGALLLGILILDLVTAVRRYRIFLGVSRWKNVTQIAGNDGGNALYGVNRDGSVATVRKTGALPWFDVGLPELDE